jgi:hypothetical protein
MSLYGGGQRGMTYAESEDFVERLAMMPDDAEEFMNMFLRSGHAPPYFLGLLMLREGVKFLEMSEHQCDDCDNPSCFGRPQHQQLIRETFLPNIQAVRESVEDLKREFTAYIYQISNCECQDCKTKDKKDAARFN